MFQASPVFLASSRLRFRPLKEDDQQAPGVPRQLPEPQRLSRPPKGGYEQLPETNTELKFPFSILCTLQRLLFHKGAGGLNM